MSESMHYTFRALEKEDIPAMHQTFLKAFSDYQLPFQLSFDQFVQKFIYKLNINYELSVGAFYNNKLIGFIFSSTGFYKGKHTAYNGGTGVIKTHRGNSLTIKMYDYLFPKLKEKNITQAVLEVLTENEKAIKNYKRCGFSVTKTYHCFKLNTLKRKNKILPALKIRQVSAPNWALYELFHDTTPYYLDSIPVLNQNLGHEHLAEASIEGKIVGYIIFQPQVSRLSQIAVDKSRRNQGVGKNLLAYALDVCHTQTLTILNVAQNQTLLISILKHMGFENTVDQYEMVREF